MSDYTPPRAPQRPTESEICEEADRVLGNDDTAATVAMVQRMVGLPADVERWPSEWQERFGERSALRQFHGGQSRADAERGAELDCRKDAARAAKETT